jgi:hypothetical protein
MDELTRLIKERFDAGNPLPSDVATHAALLVLNGWPAAKAIEESARTLDDAEWEGEYWE